MLDLVLPNWMMTPHPGLQQQLLRAAGGRWGPAPGPVPPEATAAGVTSSLGSPKMVGMEPGTPGWHGSRGATCGRKRCARAGLPTQQGRENPQRERATEASTGPPVSCLLLRGALTKKHEQRDEKPLVG